MNSLPQIIHTISYMALPLLFAMVLHEYAHGWVANRWCELLPFSNPQKQALLALDNPLIRLELVQDMLNDYGMLA